ncbi:hypothetical protein GCM10028833_37560 [Glycomyces tarimensis]
MCTFVPMREDSGKARARLQELPSVFSYRVAIDVGIAKTTLHRLRDEGLREAVGRGQFRIDDADHVVNVSPQRSAMERRPATVGPR